VNVPLVDTCDEGHVAACAATSATSALRPTRTELVERYVREWLAVQVAGGYVEHDPAGDTYRLPDEHAAVLADPLAPTYLAGSFLLLQAAYATEDQLVDAFRTGAGVGWDAHPDSCSPAPPSSSAPATSRTSSTVRGGSWRWTAWPTSCAPGRRSPTWAAGTATRPS
jgi:hypothetical protein